MYFLTFDTALDKTYIALFEDDKELVSKIIESTDDKYHSAFLVQNLVNILKEKGLTPQNLSAIGVNIGPGSFTGIRACLTIARVMAQQLNCPLIGISSLEILSNLNSSNKPSIVIMDARKGMCYFAEFDKNGNTIQEAKLESIENLHLNDATHMIITDKSMSDLLIKQNIKNICYNAATHNLGKHLGALTAKKAKIGSHHWAEVKPLYLQKPSITISNKTLL